MTGARIVAETDDYIDVQLLGVPEMETARGMTLGAWTARYVNAAHAVVTPLTWSEGGRLQEACESDFLMVEGTPEDLGALEGAAIVDDRTMRTIVHRELDTGADENGYALAEWTAEDLANDLALCSPALDGRDPSDLVPFVEEWLQRRKA